MKLKFNRLVGMILALSMMLTLLPTTAFAADPTTPTDSKASDGTYDYAYTLNDDGTATITDFLGPADALAAHDYAVTVPTELDGHKVTGIGEVAFAGCISFTHVKSKELIALDTSIQTITIPEGITTIGKSAFENCSSLRDLIINASITSMEYAAFYRCTALENLTFSDSISEIAIGGAAFGNCTSLNDFKFPENVTSIGEDAFYQCKKLEHITIPGKVQAIGKEVFYNCTALTSATLEEGIKSTGDKMFMGCTALSSVKLPESLTKIGDYAFDNCSILGSIAIPDKVTSIGEGAFSNCTLLNNVKIPNNVTSIEKVTFVNCKALSDITLNDNILVIGESAFSGCSALQEIGLPSDLKEIGTGAFALCSSLSDISLPDSVQTIGERAFNGCTKLAYIKIPDNVTTLKYRTFADDNGLKVLILPANITIEESALTYTAWVGLNAYDSATQTFSPYGAVYYKGSKEDVEAFVANSNGELNGRKIIYLCHVTLDPNGGTLTGDADVPVFFTEKITDTKANELTSISDPTRAGYKFKGWYTEANEPFDFDTTIEDDITLHAEWEVDPDAVVYHQLTVTGGTLTVKKGGADITDTLNVTTDKTTGKQTCTVPDGAEVTVTLKKDTIPEGMVFDLWSTGKFSLPLGQDYKADTITFTMSTDVDVAAQYRDATIDDSSDILGPVAAIGTAVVGGAVLGYQTYMLGTELAGIYYGLPYFPSNRTALALMLWQDAGKPMPESALLYPDMGQEEQDMDLQHAARWAMENDLLPDKNDPDADLSPEEMKFFPDDAVSKISVLRAWNKAQALKNN